MVNFISWYRIRQSLSHDQLLHLSGHEKISNLLVATGDIYASARDSVSYVTEHVKVDLKKIKTRIENGKVF